MAGSPAQVAPRASTALPSARAGLLEPILGPIAPKLVAAVWFQGYAGPIAAMFAVLLPVLFYTFLTGAWFFKLATETIGRYRN